MKFCIFRFFHIFRRDLDTIVQILPNGTEQQVLNDQSVSGPYLTKLPSFPAGCLGAETINARALGWCGQQELRDQLDFARLAVPAPGQAGGTLSRVRVGARSPLTFLVVE